jgi:hypothetical protein
MAGAFEAAGADSIETGPIAACSAFDPVEANPNTMKAVVANKYARNRILMTSPLRCILLVKNIVRGDEDARTGMVQRSDRKCPKLADGAATFGPLSVRALTSEA